MKKGFKVLSKAAVLTFAMAVFAGCGGASGQKGEGSKPFAVGVIQLVEHPALDASYKGFVDALKDNGYSDGDKITFDLQNAQGDTNNLSTICDRFINNKVDMVFAIATPSAQAIVGKTDEIPILATAVTSYEVAGLVDSDAKPGGNISGTCDMNPVAAQIALISELFPETETIGLIYNSSEDNSVLQIKIAKEAIEQNGLKYTEATVTNSNDVQQAMESLVTKCDAIYIPTDNTLASTMPTVNGVAVPAKIPTICGESNMVETGGLATMGIDYYQLGYKTGTMALEVIAGKNPGDMPIQYAERSDEVIINGEVAAEIGWVVPDKYKSSVIE